MSGAVVRGGHPSILLSPWRTAHRAWSRRAVSVLSAASNPGCRIISDAKRRVRPSWSSDQWRRDDLRRLPPPSTHPDAADLAVRPLPNDTELLDPSRPGRFAHNLAKDWPDVGAFSLERLEGTHGRVEVCVGFDDGAGEEGEGQEEVTLLLSTFLSYARRDSDGDDCPLYAFDEWILSDANDDVDDYRGAGGGEEEWRSPLSSAYAAPQCFPHDLMALMGEDEDDRPPYRWLLIGAVRSGTAPHVDPAATAAWNTLVSGSKRWVMVPPPPSLRVAEEDEGGGYGASGDYNDDDVCEGSAVHWLHAVYPFSSPQSLEGALDFVQLPGETVYVPPGWVHAAINLELSVAVTHNFVGPHNVRDALDAMRTHDPGTAARWEERLRLEGYIEGAPPLRRT